jgi:hypothetical protein
VLGCLQLLLDPMHKFPHRGDKWFSKLYPHHVCQMRMKTQ